MFEKMPTIPTVEGNNIPEQEIPQSFEKDSEPWNKIKDFIHVAVAAIVLNLAAPGTGEAAPGAKDMQALKNKMEEAKVVSYKLEKQLIELVGAKGSPGTIGDQPTKRLESHGYWTVEVGYNKDMSKAEWTILESLDGSISLIDRDNDGLLDRYVFNDETQKPWAKLLSNKLNLFLDKKSLDETFTKEAQLLNRVAAEGKKNATEIGIFTNKGGNISFHSYEKSGEIINDSSPRASEIAYAAQGLLYGSLKEIVKENK